MGIRLGASRRSFGTSSWLITRRHADGRPDNVLIDAADADAAPDAEHRVEGTEPVALDDDLLVGRAAAVSARPG